MLFRSVCPPPSYLPLVFVPPQGFSTYVICVLSLTTRSLNAPARDKGKSMGFEVISRSEGQSCLHTFWLSDLVQFNFLPLSFFNLFIYLFLAVLGLRFVRGLSLVAASGGHSSTRCGDRSSSRCAGLSLSSLSRPLPLRGTGSRRAGSAAVAHGPSCSVACGIFPDQGSNPCLLH